MNLLKTIIAELFALFVDDGIFAVVILIWLLTTWLSLHWFAAAPSFLRGGIFFAGLAIILLENTLRRAGQKSA